MRGTRKIIYTLTHLGLAGLIISACQTNSNPNEKNSYPNIVFLLVDDLGWKDLGCYGSTFYETPHIDILAERGIRFTQAYAASPVCSPSRAALITGRHPARLRITDWIPGQDPQDRPLLGPQDLDSLPLAEQTWPELLQTKGYKTSFFGKWHLGDVGNHPEDQGFDLNVGGHWAGQPATYFYPYRNNRHRWDVPGLEQGEEGEYLTDRLTDEAIQFIQEHQADPFLVYFSYYNVHTPLEAKVEDITYFQNKLDNALPVDPISEKFRAQTRASQDHPTYAAMIHSVDESVGRILQTLNQLGIERETIICFTSDNGGLSTLPAQRSAPTSNAPLRAGKGWLYEGGIRVPAILSFPGKVPMDTLVETPIIGMDFFPTLLTLAEIDFSNDELDGKDLSNLWQKSTRWSRNALFWYYPHYHGSNHRPSMALRHHEEKAIYWFEDETLEVYRMDQDISEQNDLNAVNPESAKLFQKEMFELLDSLGAQQPRKNPIH